MSDVEILRNAVKGLGTDEDAIINIATNRDSHQRQQIKRDYLLKYDRDLIEDLKGDLSFNFRKVIIGLFTDPIEYDCNELKNAKKDTLIEIIATRPQDTLMAIKDKYLILFGKNLEEEVKNGTSGVVQSLLTSILQCKRSINNKPDPEVVAKITQEIISAGDKKFNSVESVFNRYLVTLSPTELRLISQEYYNVTKQSILEAINNEYSDDSKNDYKTIVYAILEPSEYFATRLYEAIKGLGTNDSLLIRILVTRDEIDMHNIKKNYRQLYGKDLIEDIKSDTSGHYKKILVELSVH